MKNINLYNKIRYNIKEYNWNIYFQLDPFALINSIYTNDIKLTFYGVILSF